MPESATPPPLRPTSTAIDGRQVCRSFRFLVRSKYSNVLKPWVMALPAPNGLGKTLRTNSEPCNVVLRPFRMFSLGQRVQPATMIGFKQIEFFDHTASAWHSAGTAVRLSTGT